MNNLKLSIIVPVYNAEKYIGQCIESITRQKTKDMEVILINDGSTDASGELCDKYADEYTDEFATQYAAQYADVYADNCAANYIDKYPDQHGQIRVIHQENKGVLESRKRGVEAAKGEYVTFVDSDDWIEEGLLREFIRAVETMDDIDLVVSGLTCDKGRISFQKSGSLPPGTYHVAEDRISERMLYNWTAGEMGLPGYACGKLFRRDLLAGVIRDVDQGIVHGEDYAWFFSFVPLARRIVVTDCFLYHYRMHEKSTSTSFNMESFTQLQALKNYFNKQVKKQRIGDKNQAGVNQLVWGGLMHALREVYGLSVGYIFPYELVKAGSKVVIYGAGVVGRCYYNCLKSGSYAEVAALVDKNWSGMTDTAYEVCPPDRILEVPYDVVIIAVEPEELYRSIRVELKELGVEDGKIIWKKPRILRT